MGRTAFPYALGFVLGLSFIAEGVAQQGTAQDTMEKLQQFRVTSDSLEIPTVPQDDAEKVKAIEAILDRIELPSGFEIDLYAIVPDARQMAVGQNVGVVFVGTRKTDVWAVTDRDKNRVADEVKEFAPSLDKSIPNGVAFNDQGILYLAEHNRLLAFPAAEFFYEGPDVAVAVVKE